MKHRHAWQVALFSGGFRREAFEVTDTRQVDAIKDHLELSGRQFQGGFVRGRFGKVVTPSLQTLTPQAESVAAPVENLESVGVLVSEDEEMTREGISFEAVADQGVQTVESQTHVDGSRTIPELDRRGEAQHGAPPRDWSRERTKARSQPGGRRTTVPVGRTSSMGVAAGRMLMGTKCGSWSAARVVAGRVCRMGAGRGVLAGWEQRRRRRQA